MTATDTDLHARIAALEAENAGLRAERCVTLHDAADYWKEAIGGQCYTPNVHGKHVASHPTTVAQAMRVAGQRAPEVADVIAALVWKMTLADNRAAFIAKVADEQRKAAEADRGRLAEQVKDLREGLVDAAANLAGAASAYRRHASRSRTVGRAAPDALFTTRAHDFDRAVRRARAILTRTEGDGR